jgi:hypothetical protein
MTIIFDRKLRKEINRKVEIADLKEEIREKIKYINKQMDEIRKFINSMEVKK